MWHKALRKAFVAGGFWRFLPFSILKYHQKYHQPERVRWSTWTPLGRPVGTNFGDPFGGRGVLGQGGD